MGEMPQIFAKHDSEKIARHFQRHGVEALIVGGAAVAVHGCRDPYEVDDMDFLINPTIDNAERVVAALIDAGLQVPWNAKALVRPEVQLPLKVAQYWADLLTPHQDESFRELMLRSVEAKLATVTVQVVGRADLLAMKRRAVARIQVDLAKHESDLRCLDRKTVASE